MVNEQQAMAEFAASQERRNRIAVIVVIVGAVLFGALYAYRAYLRHEAQQPIIIRSTIVA